MVTNGRNGNPKSTLGYVYTYKLIPPAVQWELTEYCKDNYAPIQN